MADYKIKFEYKGIGKQASGIRQKVLQAQKSAKKDGQASTSSKDVQSINSIKKLDTTIQKLIASNKSLENSIKSQSKMPGRGGGGNLPGGGGTGGIGGMGRMGASIPILGAAIAAFGFIAKKINDVGNAYIQKAGEQIGNVGVGGFRYGRGVYKASEMGAGMKAYGMKSGKFAKGTRPDQTALDVGAIYGLSAQETLGQAGLIKRAGGDYGKIAAQGRGSGIQTEIPMLMTGISSIMEESIRNGINTSDMSKDIGKEVSALTMKTSGKSVDAAMNIIKSFSGVKASVSRGQIGTFEGMYATKASRNVLMESLTGKNKTDFLERLEKEGSISAEQRKKLSGLGKDATFADVTKSIGGAGAFFLQKKTSAEAGPAKLLRGTMKEFQKTYGTGSEAMQRASNIYAQQGGTLNQEQFRTAWMTAKGDPVDRAAEGAKEIRKQARGVEVSKSGINVGRQIQRESFLLRHGEDFAKASVMMERQLLSMAEQTIPAVKTGFSAMLNTMNSYMKKQQEFAEKIRTGNADPINNFIYRLFK